MNGDDLVRFLVCDRILQEGFLRSDKPGLWIQQSFLEEGSASHQRHIILQKSDTPW